MFLPAQAKAIIEGYKQIRIAEEGHVKYGYRYEHTNPEQRHICINPKTKECVTVYINKKSTNNQIFSEGYFKNIFIEKEYSRGHVGSKRNPRITTAANGLSTLKPKNHEVLRLHVHSEEAMRQLIRWYFNLGEDAGNAIAEPVKESEKRIIPTNEKDSIGKTRYGQGAFRDGLMKEFNQVCCMSGMDGNSFLIASHIKRWSDCGEKPDDRGNLDNGLLLSVLWDAAFDNYLISFDENWKVVASEKLTDSARETLGLNGEKKYLPEKFRNPERAVFMQEHYKRFCEKTR